MEAANHLQEILKHLYQPDDGVRPLAGIRAAEQLRLEEQTDQAVGRNLNAAFLLDLCGAAGALGQAARDYQAAFAGHPRWGRTVAFHRQGLRLVLAEVMARSTRDRHFHAALQSLDQMLRAAPGSLSVMAALEGFWRLTFPEGVGLWQDTDQKVQSLRRDRAVALTRLNAVPIRHPGIEVLFTSNVLLTLPPEGLDPADWCLSRRLSRQVEAVFSEPQRYWYDHPIAMGAGLEQNEALYGLKHLDEAVAFEKEAGNMPSDQRVVCALSVSVTHTGLQPLAREYLRSTFAEAGVHLPHLRVYAFTEADTRRLYREVLDAAVQFYMGPGAVPGLAGVFGVDGEYGRHYSFLKAIAALWQVLIDSRVRGTFKIDLDQVFPQAQLVSETGCSAFGHLRTPLWGAQGIDSRGEDICLGLLAGALVNHDDSRHSLFTPDVPLPKIDEVAADGWAFFSPLPQAVSTRSEMVARYDGAPLDGCNSCLQRVHVTGGTCGILVDSLRRYRPFTPTFIGRAEDQAYLLSVLFERGRPHLRYAHQSGLIMRHDKTIFAGEAMRAAAAGKIVGDYVRLLLFSRYARTLPWSLDAIKKVVDPFTGCFISRLPLAVVHLRLALKTAQEYYNGTGDLALKILETGVDRLQPLLDGCVSASDGLGEQVVRERQAWNAYYEVLDSLELDLAVGRPLAVDLRRRALAVLADCEVQFE